MADSRRRATMLAVSFAVGIGIGATGSYLTGSDQWWLAVPAAIAIPWLWLANPEHCLRRPGQPEPPAGRDDGQPPRPS